MLEGLRRLKLNRVASMFRTWSTNATLMGVAMQFRGSMETLVKSTLADAKREKEIALETLRVESQDGLESQERRLRQEFEEKLHQLQASEREEREVLASKREEMVQEMLRNVEDRYDSTLQHTTPYSTTLHSLTSHTSTHSLPLTRHSQIQRSIGYASRIP